MQRSQELRQSIAVKNKQLGDILQTVATEQRTGYTDEERAKVDALKKDISDLEEMAEAAEFQEERAQKAAAAKAAALANAGGEAGGQGEKREKAKISKKYSMANAVGMLLRGESFTGLEKEMREEAAKEAGRFGQSIAGIGMPSMLIRTREFRDTTVGGDAGNTVPTNLEDYEPVLRPTPVVTGIGARLRQGLTGNWDLPRKTGATAATWEGETDEAAETNPTFDKLSLTPKRLAAFTPVSRQLMLQSVVPAGIEADIREDLSTSIALALDSAAINGSGVAPIPRGILNTAGIGDVAIGADGGDITREHLVQLQREIGINDAMVANMAYLTTVQAGAKLMVTKTDAGSGIFVLQSMMGTLLGYNTAFSNQVPSNLTKGSGTDLSAVIFGDFSKLLIGQWGGVDIIVDPYTSATAGMVRLVVNSFYDVKVRQEKAFAAITDAVTTF